MSHISYIRDCLFLREWKIITNNFSLSRIYYAYKPISPWHFNSKIRNPLVYGGYITNPSKMYTHTIQWNSNSGGGKLVYNWIFSLLLFQGKIKEDIIYGVCLPATGFSALFVLLSLMTVVSVIVSGFICYHRQLAKVAEESAPEPTSTRRMVPPGPPGSPPIQHHPTAFQTSLIDWGFNTWFRSKAPLERPPVY